MNFKFTKEALEKIDADIVFVVAFQKEEKAKTAKLQTIDGGAHLDKIFKGRILAAMEAQKFAGKEGETLLIDSLGLIKARNVLVVGGGSLKKFAPENSRRIGGYITQVANRIKAASVSAILEMGKVNQSNTLDRLQAFTEGVLLANYRFDEYKEADKKNPPTLKTVLIQSKGASTPFQKAIEKAEATTSGVLLSRTLVNQPANIMTPTAIGKAAQALAKEYKNISCQVWGLKQIQSQKMGGLLGIAQGSIEPPVFIHLSYKPSKKSKTKLALVGKGITFDSGGLNLKLRDQEFMKGDMGGAATVLGVFKAIAQLKPNVAVEGFIPSCENLPSGSAVKPGDILTSRSGKTIEIINTDAEGRVVLADALDYVCEHKPTYIVDIATLTGGAAYALGELCTPVLGNDEKLVQRLLASAKQAGEMMWELPLIQHYKKGYMKGPAHIKNSGSGSLASTICGALFLEDFVRKDNKWAHLDIAFTNWADETTPYQPILGGTGIPIRTLINFVLGLA